MVRIKLTALVPGTMSRTAMTDTRSTGASLTTARTGITAKVSFFPGFYESFFESCSLFDVSNTFDYNITKVIIYLKNLFMLLYIKHIYIFLIFHNGCFFLIVVQTKSNLI